MRFRKLRIAWSVVWGAVAVLLVVLGVRSYWWLEAVEIPLPTTHSVELGSFLGCIGVEFTARNVPFSTHQEPINDVRLELKGDRLPSPLRGGSIDDGKVVFIPDWALVFTLSIFAAAAWLPYRFSLRTLLIATTLVAVVLGLIVWLR